MNTPLWILKSWWQTKETLSRTNHCEILILDVKIWEALYVHVIVNIPNLMAKQWKNWYEHVVGYWKPDAKTECTFLWTCLYDNWNLKAKPGGIIATNMYWWIFDTSCQIWSPLKARLKHGCKNVIPKVEVLVYMVCGQALSVSRMNKHENTNVSLESNLYGSLQSQPLSKVQGLGNVSSNLTCKHYNSGRFGNSGT